MIRTALQHEAEVFIKRLKPVFRKDKNMTPADLQKKLTEIMETAGRNHYYIKKEDVEKEFGEFDLDEAQMKLVYEFLMAKRIVVGGFSKESDSSEIRPEWTKEEEDFLIRYREDLMSMPLLEKDTEEFRNAFECAARGDEGARNRLSEAFLQDVVDQAVRSYTGAVLLPDMIQEGNLRLVLALDVFDYGQEDAEKKLPEVIMEEIRSGIHSLEEEQKDIHARDERLVDKVVDLKDSIEILRDEMGRKVYLDEVADFMSISEEEAEDILRLAGENIDDDEDEKAATGK